MTDHGAKVVLSLADLRAVTGFAVTCARSVEALFDRDRPGDPRVRAAIQAAQVFRDGCPRTNVRRDNGEAGLAERWLQGVDHCCHPCQVTADEWDPEAGLRIVHVKQVEFEVNVDGRRRPPPWHPEHGDCPEPDGSGDPDAAGPVPSAPPGGAATEADKGG